MQISHFWVAVAVGAMALLPMPTRAADTDAQVKAREALRSKLDQVDTNSTVTVPASKSTKPAKPVATTPAAPSQLAPAPEPQPQPVTPPPQPQPTVAPSAVAEPTPAPTQTPPPVARPVQTPIPAETVQSRGLAAPTPPPSSQPMTEQAAPRNNRPKKSPAPVIAAPAADPDKIALAREQMRQKLNAASGQENPETGATPQPVVTTAPPAQPPPVGEQAPPAPEKPKKPVPTKPTVATTEPPPAKTPAKPVKQPKQPTAQMTPVQEATYKPLE